MNRDTMNFYLSSFAKEYNLKFPKNPITDRELNLLHEFTHYLMPISEVAMDKRIMEAV